MASKFYAPGEQRAAKVNTLFSAIAPRYDRINDLQSFGLHRWWKRRLVRLTGVQPGDRALDLCCGTGDICLALARQGGRVIGLDFNRPMLSVAERRLNTGRRASRSALRAQLLCGDALNLPFADSSFDIVTIGYGLRNLAVLERGLEEMRRVVRPGGRLLALDFGRPRNALWRACYFAYLQRVVPMFGKIFCGDADAYAYILESLKHYAAQEGVASAMRKIGCTNVRVVNLLGGVMSIHCGEKEG